jgi:uncharacterized membrane protein
VVVVINVTVSKSTVIGEAAEEFWAARERLATRCALQEEPATDGSYTYQREPAATSSSMPAQDVLSEVAIATLKSPALYKETSVESEKSEVRAIPETGRDSVSSAGSTP